MGNCLCAEGDWPSEPASSNGLLSDAQGDWKPSQQAAQTDKSNHDKLISEFAFAEEANPRFRRSMEDFHDHRITALGRPHLDFDIAFFGVYDGHGGTAAASFLQQNLCDSVFEILRQTAAIEWSPGKPSLLSFDDSSPTGLEYYETPLQESFATAFSTCNASLLDEINERYDKSGSTAAIAMVVRARSQPRGPRFLHCANAGDARAVLCRGETAIRLSYDHKATDEHEQKRLEARGAFVLRGKVLGALAVSRAFGDPDFTGCVDAEPFTASIQLEDDDSHMILACDGLFDVATDEEVASFVQEYVRKKGSNDARGLAQALVQFAIDRRTTDNVTVCVVVL